MGPLTSAEKQRALRAHAQELAHTSAWPVDGREDVATIADSVLLEAVPRAFRMGQSFALQAIADELVRRTRTRRKAKKDPVTVTEPAPQ
ncbi:hypothetical protein [Thiohalocapsa marina]|uniref:hypothetical protein n=1 Tax=Thiohalocapsa marina TaxID=424902 RepID=UPI0036D94510